jgi:two-component system sensor histidine kinase TctE
MAPRPAAPTQREAFDREFDLDANPSERTARRSLLGEVLDWLLAPLFLLWPMSIAITYVAAQDLANVPYDLNLVNALEVLTQQIEVENGRATFKLSAPARLALRTRENDGVFWKVIAPSGELLGGDAELPTPLKTDTQQFDTTYYKNQIVRGFDVRFAYTWRTTGLREAGPVLVVAAESVERRVALANDIIKGVIIPQFSVLPIAAILIWFGLSRGIAPINALQKRLRARKPDDLSSIDGRNVPVEIEPLVTAMNELLARLASHILAQQRFVADAAHQLKTPLAGLRTQAELGMRGTPPGETLSSLNQIIAGTVRATRLIDQLLLMARAENPDNVQVTPVDVRALTQQQTQQWVDRAISAHIDLGFEAADNPIFIKGQALLLAELLNNLIDNSLRYTPAKGQVTVSVSQIANQAIIAVEDTGQGIPASDRERVFDRFYRVLGTKVDGSGLGLAIVREIATQHGASIHILDPLQNGLPRAGTRIEVRFEQLASEPDA